MTGIAAHPPYRPRLTPEKRLAMAQAFIDAHVPGAVLQSAEASESFTRAVYAHHGLRIGFEWRQSLGTMGIAHASKPDDFLPISVLAHDFGWEAQPFWSIDAEMELAASRMPELEHLFADAQFPSTRRRIFAALERSDTQETDGFRAPPRSRPETLVDAFRRGCRELWNEVRLWFGIPGPVANPLGPLRERLKARRQDVQQRRAHHDRTP